MAILVICGTTLIKGVAQADREIGYCTRSLFKGNPCDIDDEGYSFKNDFHAIAAPITIWKDMKEHPEAGIGLAPLFIPVAMVLGVLGLAGDTLAFIPNSIGNAVANRKSNEPNPSGFCIPKCRMPIWMKLEKLSRANSRRALGARVRINAVWAMGQNGLMSKEEADTVRTKDEPEARATS